MPCSARVPGTFKRELREAVPSSEEPKKDRGTEELGVSGPSPRKRGGKLHVYSRDNWVVSLTVYPSVFMVLGDYKP